MNASMISRRVGWSLTHGPYGKSESEQRRAEREGGARVDAVLLLELVLEAVVEEGEQELLAARPEAAGRAVEGGERDVLNLAADPAGARQLAALTGIADVH